MNSKAILTLCLLIPMFGMVQKTTTDQDTLKAQNIQLNTIIITGRQMTDPVRNNTKINHAQKVAQAKNVADLFEGLNGFSLIKRGNYAMDPSFRASQYEQLNIQFDGGTKAVHACPNRMDPITTHVVPEDIERIEVIKGPYTVRYGATFGGIVNLVSKNHRQLEQGFNGQISSGYESNGNALVSGLRLSQVTDKYDVLATLGYRNFGNYQDGSGTEVPSAFKSADYGLSLGYNINENQRIQAQWKQSFGRDVLHAGLPMDTDEDNSSILSIDYSLLQSNRFIEEVRTKVFYSKVDHIMSNTLRPSFSMVDAVATIDATTAGGKIELVARPTQSWTMYGGVDALLINRAGGRDRLVKLNAAGEVLPTPMLFQDNIWQDAFINDFGVFFENTYALSPKTTITAGVRYDLVSSDIRDEALDFRAANPLFTQTSEHNISATISAKYRLLEDAYIELAYGRGVRSANMIERYINHFPIGQDPFEYVGNPDLVAEVNNQFEVGIQGQKVFGKGIEKLEYDFSTYFSSYENYIVALVDTTLSRKFMPQAQPSEVKGFTNLDGAFKLGFEAALAIHFAQSFNLKTSLAYVYTENRDLGESLPLTPPLVSRLELGFEQEKIWASAAFIYTARQDNIATSFRELETPGYEVLNLRLGYKPIQAFQVGLAVLNVFDKTYHNHLNFSFVNQADFGRVPITDPGRNISLFAQYRF